jgi:apolipoprotein N-acyltransferase
MTASRKSATNLTDQIVGDEGKSHPAVSAFRTSHPVLLASLGAVLLWAALPPLEVWPLAWIAAIPWLTLIDNPGSWKPRQYIQWGIVGFLFWMAALHWLRLPHWATSFGWVALSFYLGWYLPAFFGLSRIGTRRLRLPLTVVAATVWAGLEVVRAHLLTGFTMASLSHTQYRWISLLQIADLGGAYAVSWVIMFVTSCLYLSGKRGLVFLFQKRACRALPSKHGRGMVLRTTSNARETVASIVLPMIEAGLVLGASLLYGQWRLWQLPSHQGLESFRVALIQGSEDIRLEDSEEKRERIHRHYLELAFRAAEAYTDLDLMVWPETVYGGLLIDHDDSPAVPPGWSTSGTPAENFREQVAKARQHSQKMLVQLAENLNSRLLLGVETIFYTRQGPRIFNSAAYVGHCQERPSTRHEGLPSLDGPRSQIPKGDKDENLRSDADKYCYVGRYDKMHLVMFGEYVPFADVIPVLQQLTPLSTSTMPGKVPVAFSVGSMRISPNICYESVIPHLIRRQVLELRARGEEPDVLVNLTNDGWFWGSSELDMHLVCGVFRAVEMRKPFLIAANTGFSAHIGPDGRIYQRGPRRDVAILVADVHRSLLRSPYLDFGWIPNSLLVAFLVVLGLAEGICVISNARGRITSRQSASMS